MQIAICDECKEEATAIEESLKNYSHTKSLSFCISQFTNGRDLIYEIEDGRHFDIVFIQDNPDTGLNTAEIIRSLNYSGEIIFTADTNEHAVDGYEVNACGYIVKPICRARLFGAMDRASNKFTCDVFRFKHRSDIITLGLNDIMYVESRNSKCIIHSTDGDRHTLYTKLSNIEEELSDDRFLRCHQSYLVNMNHIAKANKYFELVSGEKILIRQRSLKEIKNRYYDYLETK
ncbi:MAG: response regulator transcription factor [Clostridia bacterium]|nr:response regulator transcription factor [Clostridia bacterium]